MARARPLVLLVDAEPQALGAKRMALTGEFEVATASGAEAALKLLAEEWVQVIVADQRMQGMTGVEFLTRARDRWPETARILLADPADTTAMDEAGLHQVLATPCRTDQLRLAARSAARLFDLARENERLALEMRLLTAPAETRLEKRRKALRDGLGFETILRSPTSPMNAVVAQARQYASFDVPVLLTGEPGTAKTDLARAMHYGSLRSDRPFHAFNLSGVPDDLTALELFGAKRGILPGNGTRIGLVQKADRGTLYLGGIDCASPALQLTLLRVLTQGAYSPVGGQETLTTSVRIIAGSHRDLRALVAEGLFRADLYYALSAGEIAVPPLRARRGDVAILAQQILDGLAGTHGKPIHDFDTAALEFLETYDWPGNLRELTNEVTRMLIFAQGKVLGAELISRHILQGPPGDGGADRSADSVLTAGGTLKDRVELIEMRILRETLTRHRWNKSRAAAELGLSRVGLRAKLDRYGIADPSGRMLVEEEED